MKYLLPIFTTLILFIISALLINFVSRDAGLVFALLFTWPNAFFFGWWISR